MDVSKWQVTQNAQKNVGDRCSFVPDIKPWYLEGKSRETEQKICRETESHSISLTTDSDFPCTSCGLRDHSHCGAHQFACTFVYHLQTQLNPTLLARYTPAIDKQSSTFEFFSVALGSRSAAGLTSKTGNPRYRRHTLAIHRGSVSPVRLASPSNF